MDAVRKTHNNITDETKFKELRSLLPEKITDPKPTYKKLSENKDISIIASRMSVGGCIEVFSSGYIFYSCEAGEVILSIAECEKYSYAADDEDFYGDEHGSGIRLDKKAMGEMPWHVPIAMTGELRASRNSFNRKGDRLRYEPSGEDEEGNALDQWEIIADRNAIDPERAYIEKESYEERVSVLTPKQREIAEAYAEGFKQKEIGEGLDISQQMVQKTLNAAKKKL